MKTVVHLISADETEQETALNIVRNLVEDETGTIDEVAVVAQAEGIERVVTREDQGETVEGLLADGVEFKACSNTLQMMGIEESDLVGGIETVPEGAVEVTRLQNEGYAYIRP